MLVRYLKPHSFSMVVATLQALLLGAVTAVVFSLIGPALQILTAPEANTQIAVAELFGARYGQIIHTLTGYSEFRAGEVWQVVPFVLMALATLRAVLSASQWYAWEYIGEAATRDMRTNLVNSYLASDPAIGANADHSQTEAAMSSSLANDVRMIREYIVHYYGGFPRELFQIVFLTASLLLLSPKLFVIFFLVVAPAGAVIARLGKKLRRRASQVLEDYSNVTEWLQQRLLGAETIKHYGTESQEVQRFRDLTTSLNQRYLRAARMKARTSPMMELFGITAMVAVLYLALRETGGQEFAGGVQLAFFSSLAMLVQAGSKVGKYYNANKEGKAALTRLEMLLDYQTKYQRERVVGFQPAAGQTEPLIMDQVRVCYPGSAKLALDHFSYRFARGKIYCLMGPSGAGKSTLVNTILGLVTPLHGTITVSPDIANAPVPVLYLPQNIRLSPGSVGENVAYPQSDFDEPRVWSCLEAVGLRPLVEGLPEGVHTPLGRDGQGMSGGQAQRIQLARLLYHKAPLVIVDEGTSALDPEVERVIYQLLQTMAKDGATIIMIAHRPSAAQIADETIQMRDGRLLS